MDTSTNKSSKTHQRTILGFGGEIEQCGALRLTHADDAGGDEDEESRCKELEEQQRTALVESTDDSDGPMLPSPTGDSVNKTSPSSLFDADFDVAFDTKTGRWNVSNVNVLRR